MPAHDDDPQMILMVVTASSRSISMNSMGLLMWRRRRGRRRGRGGGVSTLRDSVTHQVCHYQRAPRLGQPHSWDRAVAMGITLYSRPQGDAG